MKVKCPGCGADVVFLPSSQKCYCDYCGGTFDISEFHVEELQDTKKENSSQDDIYAEFHCSSCGAKLVTDSNTIVTKCLFCGSQQMIKERLSGKFEPKEVIPFQIDKKTFMDMYAKYIHKRWLAPDEFRNNPNVIETRGLYVPFYLFEIDETVTAHGVATYRSNKQTYYHYFDMKFKDKITSPQDASINLADDIMTSLERFHLNDLTKFHPAYITGFLSETGNEEIEDLHFKAEKRAFHVVKGKIDSKITGRYRFKAGNVQIDFHNPQSKYVLLPVWFFNTWFHDKKYSYAMNGQTGKIVGEIPLSKPKFHTLMSILAVIAVFLTIAMILIYPYDYSSHSDDDDGPGGVIAGIWIAYGATYAGIKAKYRNVKKVSENPISSTPLQLVYQNKYGSRYQYKGKYPEDPLKEIVFEKARDGEKWGDSNTLKDILQ